jgi:adenylate cyclase
MSCQGTATRSRASSTFVFADLAGFTALTEAHGDEDAADLAQEFVCAAAPILAKHGAEQVKTLGDALMLRVLAPADAVRLGLILATDLLAGHGYPAVRVGMHHGPAIQRGTDWFGTTVNIAARIAALARAGEVLLSKTVRTDAGRLDDVVFDHPGSKRLRNVANPVDLYAAVRQDAPPNRMLTDPVCQMELDPARTSDSLMYGETRYHFCSSECAARFAAAPSHYGSR